LPVGATKVVNAMLVQPFINYNFPDGWYFNQLAGDVP
jgi:hypothetical protein